MGSSVTGDRRQADHPPITWRGVAERSKRSGRHLEFRLFFVLRAQDLGSLSLTGSDCQGRWGGGVGRGHLTHVAHWPWLPNEVACLLARRGSQQRQTLANFFFFSNSSLCFSCFYSFLSFFLSCCAIGGPRTIMLPRLTMIRMPRQSDVIKRREEEPCLGSRPTRSLKSTSST